MSQLDKDTIKKLTSLSRIACSDDEQEELLKDLRKILTYVEQLQEVDTSHVSPCNHVLSDIVNMEREDVVSETLSRKEFLDNTQQVGGLVKIPPVMTK